MINKLRDLGLNIYLNIPRNSLNEKMIKELDPLLINFKSLILIGNGGPDFWIKNKNDFQNPSLTSLENPIDEFCKNVFLKNFDLKKNVLSYPLLKPNVSLLELSSIAHFSHPSPLGIHISNEFGVWFAFRMLILSNEDLEEKISSPFSSPCKNCINLDCLQSCPASATSLEDFQFSPCFEYRLLKHSPCQFNCIARKSCPYKSEMTYPKEQVEYHMMHSLKFLLDLNKLKS